MRSRDEGQSTVEAALLGIGLMVPLIFAVVYVTGLHRATLAADAAAREGARAWVVYGPDAVGGAVDWALGNYRSDGSHSIASDPYGPDAVVKVTVRVTVAGPLGPLTVTRSAVAQAERFGTPDQS